jgi:hypothetical protein
MYSISPIFVFNQRELTAENKKQTVDWLFEGLKASLNISTATLKMQHLYTVGTWSQQINI